MGEGAGHSPPPLPLFWQHPTQRQSQSTQDMGKKTTSSPMKLDWLQLMLRLSAAGSPPGSDLLLIQHKERGGTTCGTSWFYFFHCHFPTGQWEEVVFWPLWGCEDAIFAGALRKPVCPGSSWPNVESWWPRRSSLEARCRPLRGWTAAASTTTSSTWWPIRWELASSSTAGSDCSWRFKFLEFVWCQLSTDY